MSSEIQQALMRIILEQGFVSWKLPENCHVILTSNPDNGSNTSYNIESLDWAQSTRFLTIEYKTEAKIWAAWAEGNEVPSYAINFVLHMPEVLEDEKFKMNSRILTLFFHSLVSVDPKQQIWYLKALGERATSNDFIAAFTSFIIENDELMSLLTPEQILNNNTKSVFEFVQKYRGNQAILGMLIFRLENYIQHRVSKGTFTDNEAKQFIEIIVESYEKDKMFTKDMISAIVLNTWSIDNRLKTLATKLPQMFRNIMIGDI